MSHRSVKRFSKVSSADIVVFVLTFERDLSLTVFLLSCLSFVAIFCNRSLVTAMKSLWNKRNNPKEGISCSGLQPEKKKNCAKEGKNRDYRLPCFFYKEISVMNNEWEVIQVSYKTVLKIRLISCVKYKSVSWFKPKRSTMSTKSIIGVTMGSWRDMEPRWAAGVTKTRWGQLENTACSCEAKVRVQTASTIKAIKVLKRGSWWHKL